MSKLKNDLDCEELFPLLDNEDFCLKEIIRKYPQLSKGNLRKAVCYTLIPETVYKSKIFLFHIKLDNEYEIIIPVHAQNANSIANKILTLSDDRQKAKQHPQS